MDDQSNLSGRGGGKGYVYDSHVSDPSLYRFPEKQMEAKVGTRITDRPTDREKRSE